MSEILTGFRLNHGLHYGLELHARDQVIDIMRVIIIMPSSPTDPLFPIPIERFLRNRWGTGLR